MRLPTGLANRSATAAPWLWPGWPARTSSLPGQALRARQVRPAADRLLRMPESAGVHPTHEPRTSSSRQGSSQPRIFGLSDSSVREMRALDRRAFDIKERIRSWFALLRLDGGPRPEEPCKGRLRENKPAIECSNHRSRPAGKQADQRPNRQSAQGRQASSRRRRSATATAPTTPPPEKARPNLSATSPVRVGPAPAPPALPCRRLTKADTAS